MLHRAERKTIFGVRVVGRVRFEVLHGLHVHVHDGVGGLKGSLDARGGTVHDFRGRVGGPLLHGVDVGICLRCISTGDGD